jgi:hypothetical protein
MTETWIIPNLTSENEGYYTGTRSTSQGKQHKISIYLFISLSVCLCIRLDKATTGQELVLLRWEREMKIILQDMDLKNSVLVVYRC